MTYTVTAQPVRSDGLALDMPDEETHLELFTALGAAHDVLRRARTSGAGIAVNYDEHFEWLATYTDGDALRVSITDDGGEAAAPGRRDLDPRRSRKAPPHSSATCA